jgi:hypothetical protein
MGPGMRANLVTGVIGILYTSDRRIAVDAIPVISVEKEGAFSSSFGKLI